MAQMKHPLDWDHDHLLARNGRFNNLMGISQELLCLWWLISGHLTLEVERGYLEFSVDLEVVLSAQVTLGFP